MSLFKCFRMSLGTHLREKAEETRRRYLLPTESLQQRPPRLIRRRRQCAVENQQNVSRNVRLRVPGCFTSSRTPTGRVYQVHCQSLLETRVGGTLLGRRPLDDSVAVKQPHNGHLDHFSRNARSQFKCGEELAERELLLLHNGNLMQCKKKKVIVYLQFTNSMYKKVPSSPLTLTLQAQKTAPLKSPLPWFTVHE